MAQIYYPTKKIAQWGILAPLCAFLLYDFIQLNMMSALGSFLLQSMRLSATQLGFASSLFFYVNLILLWPAGTFLDRYSPKWLIAASICIAVVGLLSFVIFQSITTLFIWRALTGVAGAFSYLSCIKILASVFPRKYLGLLIGLTGIVIMSAGVIAQFPLITLIQHVGMRTALSINATLGILVGLLVVNTINVKNLSNKLQSPTAKNSTTWDVYYKKENLIIAAYACLTNFPLFVLGALWGNLYLQKIHSVSLTAAALLTSMIFIGNMFGAPILGFISDRLHNRKLLMVISSGLFLITIFLISILPTMHIHILFYSLFFILGVSTGAQTLAYASVVDINSSENTAKATSLLSFFSVGGAAIAQPLFGWIIDLSSPPNYQNGMYILLLSSGVALLLSIFYSKSQLFSD